MLFTAAIKEKFGYSGAAEMTRDYKLLTKEDKRDLYHGLKRDYPDVQAPAGLDAAFLAENPNGY